MQIQLTLEVCRKLKKFKVKNIDFIFLNLSMMNFFIRESDSLLNTNEFTIQNVKDPRPSFIMWVINSTALDIF